MASLLREVVVDCRDPRGLARFWGEVLGWTVVDDDAGYSWISSTGEPWAPAPLLVFAAVPEPKTAKNRLHLDVNPSGCDQSEELERLTALGARRVDVGQGETPWIVVADPEDNEFCLLGRRIDP
ncbi:MAG: VOC family protein [Acidimicrobiales bacterium]